MKNQENGSETEFLIFLEAAIDQQQRLSRNFYKGIKGEDINVMLASAAMNFKRMMNIWKNNLWQLFYRFIIKKFYLLNGNSYYLALYK